MRKTVKKNIVLKKKSGARKKSITPVRRYSTTHELYDYCCTHPGFFDYLVADTDLALAQANIKLQKKCLISLKEILAIPLYKNLAAYFIMHNYPWRLWVNLGRMMQWCADHKVPWISIENLQAVSSGMGTYKMIDTEIPPCPWGDCPPSLIY